MRKNFWIIQRHDMDGKFVIVGTEELVSVQTTEGDALDTILTSVLERLQDNSLEVTMYDDGEDD